MGLLARLVAATCVGLFALSAQAEDYPTRAITIVVPFAAGGGTDAVTRILAEHIGPKLGQNVIVENAAGAGGTVGALRVARAQPDGYTLLMGNLGTHAASMVLYPNKGYDPQKDFEPVALIAVLPLFVGARKSLPLTDFKTFIDYVKANHDKMNYGSAGVGSSGHMVCHFLNQLIGVDVQHVPYRASGQALTALLAGDVDYVCDAAGAITEQISAGNVRGLVVSAKERLPALPDMPTSVEQGLPAFQAVGWNMVFAPKGTPPEITSKLFSAMENALNDPAFKKRLLDLGALVPKPSEANPAASRQLVRDEIEKWVPVLISAGIKPN
jgi:tripartite-type tricarboxylate transporter receptor subunit TctC